MEIKVICDCGTKFKFEITPIRGKMPFAVNCPACGADTTAQANAIIAQAQPTAAEPGSLVAPATEIAMPPANYSRPPAPAHAQAAPVAYSAPVPSVPQAAPVAYQPQPAPAPAPAVSMTGAVSIGGLRASRPAEPTAAPVASAAAASAPPPPAPPPAGGLRINRSAALEHTSAPPPQTPPPAMAYQRPAAAAPKANKAKNALVTVGSTLVVLVALGFGALKIGSKWYRRIKSVVNVASALSDDSSSNSDFNLDDDEEVVIYVQQTNHMSVADACRDFWKEKLNMNLLVTKFKENDALDNGQYGIISSYNGWVRIVGASSWKAQNFEGLSQYLSQRFGGVVFETGDASISDEATSWHFGVYEAGARKFHGIMDVTFKNDDLKHKITTEGDDWAKAHGFKPDSKKFMEFVEGANKLTVSMGMKLWDQPFDQRTVALTLKESKR